MSNFVSVQLRRPTFEKLHRLAVLTGDESSAIERLIAHWESSVPSGVAESPAAYAVWHSSSGDVLNVGEVLRGSDGGKTHEATVEQDGIRFMGQLYDSPSAAARAVKALRGLKGPAASTNGRDFWHVRDSDTNRWVPIKARGIDSDKLLNQLAGRSNAA